MFRREIAMAERKLEDFIVNGNYNNLKKNNKKTAVIVVISLVLVLVAIVCGYFAYNKYLESKDDTAKDLFLSYVLDNNVKDIVENELYEDAINTLVEELSIVLVQIPILIFLLLLR